jgi:hypothetical protein
MTVMYAAGIDCLNVDEGVIGDRKESVRCADLRGGEDDDDAAGFEFELGMR